MKIQYASDLHIEFHDNGRWLKENPLIPVGEILVLAGDIGYLGDEMYSNHPFWRWCSDNFSDTYVVPGNHELYKRYDINSLTGGFSKDVLSNVHVVYNKVIPLSGDIDLIASTLWSHIENSDAYYVENGVSDFRRIMDGERPLSWLRFNAEHESCKSFICDSVKSSKARNIVVVTHHVPSYGLLSDDFRNSRINGAFTSNLDDMIMELRINYWIYGHSHRNIDKKIYNTNFVSNQLGYVFANEHTTFNRNKYIEI